MRVWRRNARCQLVAGEVGATITRAFQAQLFLQTPSNFVCEDLEFSSAPSTTPNHVNINISSSAASRSPPVSMDLANAPEELTKGLDALYLERAGWALKTRQPSANVLKGCKRPDDPASASKTLEELIELASITIQTRK